MNDAAKAIVGLLIILVVTLLPTYLVVFILVNSHVDGLVIAVIGTVVLVGCGTFSMTILDSL